MNENKYLFIGKPCQSGKTSITIDKIKEIYQIIDAYEKYITIVFCANSLLQTQQFQSRVDATHLNAEILSSKSQLNHADSLYRKICSNKLNFVICCFNSTQIENIDGILQDLQEQKYIFNIFIDEADATATGNLSNYIKKWATFDIIKHIVFITATPDRIFSTYDSMNIHPLEISYSESYHKIEDSEIIYIEKSLDYYVYLQYILTTYFTQNNYILYCPAEIKIKSHDKTREILVENGFTVIVINSEGNYIYSKEGFIEIDDCDIHEPDRKNEVSVWLAKIYTMPKYVNSNKVAITGNLSIGRGITISSPKLMITDAILPIKIKNKCSLYQLTGRISGNIKNFPNYKKIRIYSIKEVIDSAIMSQNKIIEIVEKAYHDTMITKEDWDNINLVENNKYGIPIKIRFTDIAYFDSFYQDINSIYKKYNSNKLDKKGNIEKEIKQKFIEYSSYYVFINNNKNIKNNKLFFTLYKLKNIKRIDSTLHENTNYNKYPLIKIQQYINAGKRYEAEKKNCSNEGDSIMYILADMRHKCLTASDNSILNSPLLHAPTHNMGQDSHDIMKGDIFITFWNKS